MYGYVPEILTFFQCCRPPNKVEAPKVPTTITYNVKKKKFLSRSWGQLSQRDSSNHDEQFLAHFKLLLLSPDPFVNIRNSLNKKDIDQLVDRNSKIFDTCKTLKPLDVVVEYLSNLNKWVYERIKGLEDVKYIFSKQKKIKAAYVITVPAAMNKTTIRYSIMQAAVKANIINKDETDARLIIITEPAAAALHCE